MCRLERLRSGLLGPSEGVVVADGGESMSLRRVSESIAERSSVPDVLTATSSSDATGEAAGVAIGAVASGVVKQKNRNQLIVQRNVLSIKLFFLPVMYMTLLYSVMVSSGSSSIMNSIL